jgi:hypothetical protein
MKLPSSLSQWPWNSNLSSRIEDGGSRIAGETRIENRRWRIEDRGWQGDTDRESGMED